MDRAFHAFGLAVLTIAVDATTLDTDVRGALRSWRYDPHEVGVLARNFVEYFGSGVDERNCAFTGDASREDV